jgi:hypothetical protein
LRRYFYLRDQVLAKLEHVNCPFTDQDIREWQLAYDARKTTGSSQASSDHRSLASHPSPPSSPPASSGLAQAVGEPVQVRWHDERTVATVLHASESLLLLQGPWGHGGRPAVGALLTVRLAHQKDAVEGRLAGFGPHQVFLIALGRRGIRQAPRYKVHLPAVAYGGALPGPVRVTIVDLSRSGARVQGLQLPLAEQLDLTFYPPGSLRPTRLHAVVTHATAGEPPEMGVAFCLATLDLEDPLIRQLPQPVDSQLGSGGGRQTTPKTE